MFLRIVIALFALTFIFSGCGRKVDRLEKNEEGIISNGVGKYAEAFNAHDTNAIGEMWTDDGSYVNMTTNETYEGKQAIKDYYTKLFNEDGAEKIKTDISTTYSLSDIEAVAKGLAIITFKDGTEKKEAFVAQFIQSNGKWLLQNVSINDLEPPLSHFEKLKDLDWLVGDWIDDDDNIDVDYSYAWDQYKNFLTQNFALSVLDQEVLTGIQIIGWDPTQESVKSWIFDSDGGFGEATWDKQDDTWYATVKFTLPQGGVGSAMHVYKKIDDNLYTFSSENRVVDGNLLPNIGPFKVIRE